MGVSALQRLAVAYKRSLEARNLSKLHIEATLRRVGRFIAYLQGIGVTHVDGITKEALKSYQVMNYHALNSKGRPNSIMYQNMMLSSAKGFLGFMKEEGFIVSDPSRGVEYAKAPKRLPRGVMSPAEAKKVIHAPDTRSVIGYRDRTILEVLYSTGIRKSELNNLTLSDVDYDEGLLRVISGKGGKDRVVPVGRIACRYLENYIKTVRPMLIRDPYDDHLFLSARGRKLSKNTLWEMVRKYAKRARVTKDVYPHCFRHSCATSMLKNKADIRVIQELLGHASLTSTQVYTHLAITDLKEIHARCHPREKDAS